MSYFQFTAVSNNMSARKNDVKETPRPLTLGSCFATRILQNIVSGSTRNYRLNTWSFGSFEITQKISEYLSKDKTIAYVAAIYKYISCTIIWQ